MKKLLSFLIALSLVLGVGIALATDISDAPMPGLFKSQLSSSQKPGAYCVIGPNTYRYVLNNSATIEYQGEPAFYNWNAGNDYTVGYGLNTSSYEAFAGIWACDAFGDDTVAASTYGWIQTKGANSYAYVSGEGTAIAVGDVLGFSVLGNYNSDGNAGSRWLARLRGVRTTTTVVTTEARDWPGYPRAGQAYSTTTAAAQKTIILR
jgi:hypothetical protein